MRKEAKKGKVERLKLGTDYAKYSGCIDVVDTDGGDWVHVETTIDSGAVDTVCGPDVAKEYVVNSTEASRRGEHWISASGDPILHHGEKVVVVTTGSQDLRTMKYQVADVTKPLASVDKICAAGHRVVFDDEGSYNESKSTGKKDWLRKRNNTYVLDTWVMPAKVLNQVMPGQTFAGRS